MTELFSRLFSAFFPSRPMGGERQEKGTPVLDFKLGRLYRVEHRLFEEPWVKPTESSKHISDLSLREHFLPCPWAIMEKRAGGVDSVFLAEARKRECPVTFMTTDTEAFEIEGVQVQPAKQEAMPRALFERWFGMGHWQILYPGAFTEAACPQDVLEEMYAAGECVERVGSLERLIEHVGRHSPPAEVEERFNARFDGLINDIPSRAIVNWQDFFFEPSIRKHAESLRARGCLQTFHLHETLPESLHRSEFGRGLIHSMSRVDAIFLHTDLYIERLEKQFEALEYREIPRIARFDLGIDKQAIDRSLETVNRENFRSHIPHYEEAPARQRALLEEVFRSQEVIPHRFMIADRIDATKGSIIVVRAIERFLDGEAQKGLSLEELRKQYRFFGLHDLIGISNFGPLNLSHQYIRQTLEAYARVQRKYPGIVFISEPLSGASRVLLPAAMRGCHGVSGGAEDGLNLSIMENAYVNRDRDTSIIIGTGAGFAIQSLSQGLAQTAYFPRAGSVEEMAEAIVAIVKQSRTATGNLAERKSRLLQKAILPREASMLIDPEKGDAPLR